MGLFPRFLGFTIVGAGKLAVVSPACLGLVARVAGSPGMMPIWRRAYVTARENRARWGLGLLPRSSTGYLRRNAGSRVACRPQHQAVNLLPSRNHGPDPNPNTVRGVRTSPRGYWPRDVAGAEAAQIDRSG